MSCKPPGHHPPYIPKTIYIDFCKVRKKVNVFLNTFLLTNCCSLSCKILHSNWNAVEEVQLWCKYNVRCLTNIGVLYILMQVKYLKNITLKKDIDCSEYQLYQKWHTCDLNRTDAFSSFFYWIAISNNISESAFWNEGNKKGCLYFGNNVFHLGQYSSATLMLLLSRVSAYKICWSAYAQNL